MLANLSIKNKLVLIILVISLVIITAGFGVIMVLDVKEFKQEKIEHSESMIQIICEYLVAPMEFGDKELILESLKKTASINGFNSIDLYDRNGKEILIYGDSTGINAIPSQNPLTHIRSYYSESFLHISAPVTYNDEYYGAVYARISTQALSNKIKEHIYLLILLSIPLFLLSWLLALYFQKVISARIERVSSATRQVAENGVSVEVLSSDIHDEIGQLYDNFNLMLEQLQSRENETKVAQEETIKSNERLGLVLDSVTNGYWDWDIEKDQILLSNRWKITLGYSELDYVDGKQFWKELIFSEDVSSNSKMLESHLNGEISNYENEIRIHTKEGPFIWIQNRGKVVEWDQKGNPLRMVGAIVDISIRKAIEEKQRALEDQLQISQRMETIGTLAGGIAHDFKNLLMPILGYTEIELLNKDHAEQTRKNLEYIHLAAKRGNGLVNQILTFSRRSDQEVKKIIDLTEIVHETYNMVRALIPANVELNLMEEATETKLNANSTQIHQVILNLCTNALQAMESEVGKIDIRLYNKVLKNPLPAKPTAVPSGDYLIVEIKDEGKGIPEKSLTRIFEPFYTTKKEGQGTGLGLSVVHGVVKKHQGSITVDSVQGVGTTFKVYLPVHKSDAAIVAENEQGDFVQTSGTSNRVLVVDDNELNILLYEQMLKNLNHSSKIFLDSVEALNYYKEHMDEFDMIISDYSMPNMTGLQLAEEINTLKPEAIMFIITGSIELKEKALQVGIVKDCVLKPIDMTKLSELINKWSK